MKKLKTPKPVEQTYKAKPFAGVDWSSSLMRPGCQDFLKCPSRRADGLHEYRPPILNASSMYSNK